MNTQPEDPTTDHEPLLERIAVMYDHFDPAPADLADRVLFALQLDDLEVEVARLSASMLAGSGTRSNDTARTVTFSSEQLSVMITVSVVSDGVRLDGWVTGGADLSLTVRAGGREIACATDEDGRFVADGVPHGMVQLLFPVQRGLSRSVVTPAIEV